LNSVINTIACPRCGGEAYSEFYYNCGEEDTSCLQCGYQYHGRYQRDEHGKLVTQDNTTDYRFDNLIWTERKVEPYACFHVKYKSTRGVQCGSLDNEEAVAAFKSEVERNKSQITRAYISRYDEEKKEVVVEKLAGTAQSKKEE
jgi:hypothetical protein